MGKKIYGIDNLINYVNGEDVHDENADSINDAASTQQDDYVAPTPPAKLRNANVENGKERSSMADTKEKSAETEQLQESAELAELGVDTSTSKKRKSKALGKKSSKKKNERAKKKKKQETAAKIECKKKGKVFDKLTKASRKKQKKAKDMVTETVETEAEKNVKMESTYNEPTMSFFDRIKLFFHNIRVGWEERRNRKPKESIFLRLADSSQACLRERIR